MSGDEPAEAPVAASVAPPSAPPPGADEVETVRAPAGPPLDDDDTRGLHLRRFARHPLTISLTLTGMIAGFAIGTLASGVAIGAAAAGGVLLLAFAIVWALASGRAKEDFLNAYAQSRGLARQGRGHLPPLTPLLRRGDDRYATERMSGNLAGVEPGTLAHYTYEETSTDSKGNRTTTYYHFTVGVCQVPESAVKASELYLQRRFGFRFLDGFEDVFRRKQRVEVESELMDKRFETFADPKADPNWLRQLFSPSFIVWLAEEAPDSFAFELVAGALVANAKGHLDSAEELDAFSAATATVARRIREESLEAPVGGAAPSAI